MYPTLVCLLGQKVNFNYEIVIVDSGKDNTKEYVKELRKVYKNIKYRKIKYCKNRSLLRNIGVSISTGEILVFLDNDMLCPPDFLQYHYDKHIKESGLVLLGLRKSLINFDLQLFGVENLVENFSYLDKLPYYIDERINFNTEIEPWRFVYSHTMSMRRKTFRIAKGFNKRFGNQWGLEDLEFGFRLLQNHFRFEFLGAIYSYHQPHLMQSTNEQKKNTS